MAGQAMSHDYHITVIGGLPCIARVHSFYPIIPATWHHPEEGGEVDWELLDRRGRQADWIEKRMTEKERQRLEDEVYELAATDYKKRYDDY